jgi:hypothetical protein
MPVREVCRDGWSRKFHMWYTIDYCASSVCNPVGLILSEEEAATAGADPGVTATGHVASSRPLIHARGSMGGDITDVASNRPYRGGPRYNQLCGSLVLTPSGCEGVLCRTLHWLSWLVDRVSPPIRGRDNPWEVQGSPLRTN